jgi:ribosomal protein S12 methylthiotransferase accessory factor
MPGRASAATKTYWSGTHRTAAPGETLERFERHGLRMGITRLANVTGLDYLGLPVFMGVRPNSRSLSVSQGKGLNDAAARASAFMEAAEHYHAEHIALPLIMASYKRLQGVANAVNPALLPRIRNSLYRPDLKIGWIEGLDIVSGERALVPVDLAHCDFTKSLSSWDGCFLPTTNGLASGNHRLEAISAGLCEVIERDATRLWQLRRSQERAARRLALHTVDDQDSRVLLEHLADRSMAVTIWDITSDIEVASFLCRIQENSGNTRSNLGAFSGAGSHVHRGVALSRAITEAVQSRLTYIAGSRDDLRLHHFAGSPDHPFLELANDLWEQRYEQRGFAQIPSATFPSLEDDIQFLIARLRAAGLKSVIVVDLTQDQIAIPVVRVVVPGLEGFDEYDRFIPGSRARKVARTRQ